MKRSWLVSLHRREARGESKVNQSINYIWSPRGASRGLMGLDCHASSVQKCHACSGGTAVGCRCACLTLPPPWSALFPCPPHSHSPPAHQRLMSEYTVRSYTCQGPQHRDTTVGRGPTGSTHTKHVAKPMSGMQRAESPAVKLCGTLVPPTHLAPVPHSNLAALVAGKHQVVLQCGGATTVVSQPAAMCAAAGFPRAAPSAGHHQPSKPSPPPPP